MGYYQIAVEGTPYWWCYHGEGLEVGDIVEVPLRTRRVRGVVIEETSKPQFETKGVLKKLGSFSEKKWEFFKFIYSYYFVTPGEALKLFYRPELSNPNLNLSPLSPSHSIEYTPAQLEAIQFLKKGGARILFGDTGSGKTEIYIELIKEALEQGKTALFLLPEIAITSQMEKRLRGVFGEWLGVWHSQLPKRHRSQLVERVATGEVRVIVGARSALFLPFEKLGVVVVDEEHDDSYKSDKAPKYNGKDLAILLGKLYSAPVVLGSATPLVADLAKFPHYRLRGTYFKGERIRHFIPEWGEAIYQKMEETLKRGQQVVIFLPTRGNFKYMICRKCGESIKCPNCDVAMSLHRREKLLKCHYCNKTLPIPSHCPNCGGEEFTHRRKGTKELVEELKERFPDRQIERLDRDRITSKKRLDSIVTRFEKGEIDILVGTQMVSKGHNFLNLGLAVVADVDFLLATPDYRARERGVALVKQVEGRTGRKGRGEVIIQTSHPYLFNREYDAFVEEELESRKLLNYPPFSRLIKVKIGSKTPEEGEARLQEILKCLGEREEVVGYGPSPIFKLKGVYRYYLLLKGKNLHSLLYPCLNLQTGRKELVVDPDPVTFI